MPVKFNLEFFNRSTSGCSMEKYNIRGVYERTTSGYLNMDSRLYISIAWSAHSNEYEEAPMTFPSEESSTMIEAHRFQAYA